MTDEIGNDIINYTKDTGGMKDGFDGKRNGVDERRDRGLLQPEGSETTLGKDDQRDENILYPDRKFAHRYGTENKEQDINGEGTSRLLGTSKSLSRGKKQTQKVYKRIQREVPIKIKF